VIGPTRFHNLVTDYLLVHPSTHPSLRFAGRHLPRLLDTHPLAADWPFLADLARLEWAIVDAFDAADVVLLTEQDLDRLPVSAWADLRFRLVPSVRLLEARSAVQDVWSQVDRGAPPAAPAATPTHLLVWRKDLRVFHRPIDGAEQAALLGVQDGKTFGAICEHAAARRHLDSPHSAAAILLGIVMRWLADGLLAAG
jgi:hypothetical protein